MKNKKSAIEAKTFNEMSPPFQAGFLRGRGFFSCPWSLGGSPIATGAGFSSLFLRLTSLGGVTAALFWGYGRFFEVVA